MSKPKGEKQNPYHREYGVWSNICFIFGQAIKNDKAFLWLIPIGMISAPVMQYVWTFISKLVIDMITGEAKEKELFGLLLGFVLLQMVAAMLNSYYTGEQNWRCIRFRFRLQNNALNDKVLRIDYGYLEDSEVTDCYSKARGKFSNNRSGVEGMLRALINFFRTVTVVAVGMVILGTMDAGIIVAMLVLAGISFFVSNHTHKAEKKSVWDPLASWWNKKYYMDYVMTDFEIAKDIRMFCLKDWLLKKYHDLNRVKYQAEKKSAGMWLIAGTVSDVCWAGAQIVIYGWLIGSVAKGTMALGNFSLYVAATERFFKYISMLLDNIRNIVAISREIDDVRSFLDFAGGDEGENGIEVPACSSYEFRFENVSFRYPKAENYALKNVTMTLHAGERLAVVGLNGAGKSTFINLLLRLYEPTEGTIYLNGVDIGTYNKRSYYRVFAPVFQEVKLFAFPLAENISMKPPAETNRKRAEQCLIDAGFEERLKELEKGVDTEVLKVIHEDGVVFSGGEKQKIALARALYKKAPVVVLDEPTAALDALAECRLYQEFDRLIGGKTAVYISHRLSSTRFCNHVAMFADGELVEYGTHQSLLEKKGAYAEMFAVQAQYYIEGNAVAESEAAVC